MTDHSSSQQGTRTCAALIDNPGALTENAQPVIVGCCVSNGAAARSSLLSGLESTEGLACLPCRLSAEDVRLWQTACRVGSDHKFVIDELVTVYKVSDALGDAESTTWQELLASRTVAAPWTQPQVLNDTLAALFRLPPHLLRRVLSSCLQTHPILHLLDTLPPALHPSLAAAAADEALLTVPCSRALTLLPHLLAPAAASSLRPRCLFLDDHTRAPDACTGRALPTAVGALLGRAASALTSLTFLLLAPEALSPQWLRHFSDCLSPGALPVLKRLKLSMDHLPGSNAELAACLSHLPTLLEVNIAFVQPDDGPAAEVSLVPHARRSANAATLAHLRWLTLSDSCDLGGVTIEGHHSPALAFLPFLDVPAETEWTLELYLTPPDVQTFISLLLRFPSLRSLYISMPALRQALRNTLEACTGTHFPALTNVIVNSECATPGVALTAALASRAHVTLTSLELCPEPGVPTYDEGLSTAHAVAREFELLSDAIAACTHLRNLSLKCLGCSPETSAKFNADLSAALAPLVHLTALELVPIVEGVEVVLEGEVIGSRLCMLTALEELVLREVDPHDRDWRGRLTLDAVQPVMNACAKLARLKEVHLCCTAADGVTVEQVAELLQRSGTLKAVACSFDFGGGAEDVRAQSLAVLQARYRDVSIRECRDVSFV